MNPLTVAPFMAMIAGIGTCIDSIETLVARDALTPTGLYSWSVLSLSRRYFVVGPFSKLFGKLFCYPSVLVLPVVQLVTAAVLISGPFLPMNYQRLVVASAALTAALARILFYVRQQLGLDGADQMLVIVLLSAGFGTAFGNTATGRAAVDYAALQLLLSYAVSGGAKAVSAHWRSGRAIVGITGTIGYGQPWANSFFKRWPTAARIVCWSVILFECAAVPLLLLGTKGAWVVIVIGICFHIGVAFVMGLNIFVWAFAGCYPALLLLATQIEYLFGIVFHIS